MEVEPTTVYSRLLASDLPSQQGFEYLRSISLPILAAITTMDLRVLPSSRQSEMLSTEMPLNNYSDREDRTGLK